MVSLGLAHPMDKCWLCGSLITKDSLSEHLKADLRMLDVIRTNHPDWGQKRCTEYLRELYGTGNNSKSELNVNPLVRGDLGEPEAPDARRPRSQSRAES